MHFHAALALAACLAPAAAIYEDDAYHIDFHYALLGLPKHEATFFQKPYAGSKASLLYSISQNQTIGAINPKDGALVWRQHAVSEPTGKGHLRAGSDQDTVISAVGDRVTAWSASDGRLVWETSVEGSDVEDLEILEQEDGITNNEAKDAVVLVAGGSHGVKRLDGKTGRVKWTYEDTRLAILLRTVRHRLRQTTAETYHFRYPPRLRPSTTYLSTQRCSEDPNLESRLSVPSPERKRISTR